MINMKIPRKMDYVKCVLKRIELSKKILITNLEMGFEAYITPDISVEKFPQSFQYYDALMLIIRTDISDERKEFFIKKSQLAEKQNKISGFFDNSDKLFIQRSSGKDDIIKLEDHQAR